MTTLDQLLLRVNAGLPTINGVDPTGATTILPSLAGTSTLGNSGRPWLAAYATDFYTAAPGNCRFTSDGTTLATRLASKADDAATTSALALKANATSPTFYTAMTCPTASAVTFGGVQLSALISGGSTVAITACTNSDTWTITTNNSSGNVYAHVTPAFNPTALTGLGTVAQPVFTSNTAITTSTQWPSGSGWIADASASTADAWNAFQGSSSTSGAWEVLTAGPWWISITYPSNVTISSFDIKCTSDLGRTPIGFQFQWSDNNSTWTTAQTYSILQSTWPANNTVQNFTLPAQTPHRYYRLYITTTTGGQCNLRAFTLYSGFSAAGLLLRTVVPVSTSQFKIVLSGPDGVSLNASAIPINVPFYITLYKGGFVVCTGLYTLSNSSGGSFTVV